MERNAHNLRSAFTLMEIVLAIALTSVVMYLLTSAIELFMFRVESSRSRVESAQIARTLLDQMAADLVATRLYAPPSTSGGSGGSGSGAGGTGSGGAASESGGAAGDQGGAQTGTPPTGAGTGTSGAGGNPAGTGTSGSSGEPLTVSSVSGIYGDVEQIRIDRSAPCAWQRAAREVDPQEATAAGDMPLTVRYYVVDGDRLTAQELAQRGVSEEDERESPSTAGLYRQTAPTAALSENSNPLDAADDSIVSEKLLAPEVVKLELQYYNGQDLVDAWDAFDEGGLPTGVEIRLTIHEPRAADPSADESRDRYGTDRIPANELVEYRRFVRIPTISPPQPADSLLPAESNDASGGQGGAGGAGQGGAGAGGQGGGQNQGQGGNANTGS